MQIWQSVYGKVRLSGSARARRWVSGRRRSTIGNRSEAQWLRTRRSAVDNLASHSKKRTLADMEEASTRQSAIAWTDRHSQARSDANGVMLPLVTRHCVVFIYVSCVVTSCMQGGP